MDLDPQLSALCDSAAAWLACAADCSLALGVTLPAGIAAMLPRLFTGYSPKAQRTASLALAYRNGLKVAPRRSNADDKAKAEAVRWGLAVPS